VKLLNWNLEWRSARSRHASVIRRELEREDLEVVCLTETLTDWLKRDGEWIEAEGDYGYGPKATRRKVALWARDGFSSVTNVSVEGMPPGRFVSGLTKGGARVVGVCIPCAPGVRAGLLTLADGRAHRAAVASLKRRGSGLR